MRMKNLTGALLLTFVAASAATLLADSKIEYKVTEGTTTAMTILIGQGKIRSEVDANSFGIIDPTEGSMTLVDNGKKTFTKITKADLQQMAQMMADMDKQLAAAPPEVRQMMASRMGGGGTPSVTAATGEKATVAGKSCQIYRTTQGTKTTAEYCMADASAIDISAADRATMTASIAWSKELTDTLAKSPMMGQIANSMPFRAGMVPVRTTIFDANGGRTTTEFVGVSNGAIPATMFAVPSGYKEQKLPTMGRGRGGN